MLILNESECATGLYDWSTSLPLIWELTFSQWSETNLHASEQSPSLILGAMSERSNFILSGRYLIGMGGKFRLVFLFLLYFTNKAFFRIFYGDSLKLHQFSLSWEFYLVDEIQYVKPQVWIYQIMNEYLQYMSSGSSYFCIDWSRPRILHVRFGGNWFHQACLDMW